jgi:hypothetical protein
MSGVRCLHDWGWRGRVQILRCTMLLSRDKMRGDWKPTTGLGESARAPELNAVSDVARLHLAARLHTVWRRLESRCFLSDKAQPLGSSRSRGHEIVGEANQTIRFEAR